MNASQVLRNLLTGRTAGATPSDRLGPPPHARFESAVLRLAHVVSVGLAALVAAGVLTLASLRAVEADPAIVGAPASAPVDPADITRVAGGLAFASPTGDSLTQCFYDALASLGGTVDGRGHQRTDPACQRR